MRMWKACAAAIVTAAPVFAIGEPAPKVEWVEVDAPMMCAMMAREYRGRAIRDHITVSAATAVEKKTDSFDVFVGPDPDRSDTRRIDIVIGPLHVVALAPEDSESATLTVAHAKVLDRVVSVTAESGGALALLQDTMPPIPMPQVWLAMGPAKPPCPPMGPYLGAVEWSRAELSPEAVPPRLRMFGIAEDTGAAVELIAIVEPEVRIERITIRDEAESSTIEIRIDPVEDGALPPPDAPGDRRIVKTLAELVSQEKTE